MPSKKNASKKSTKKKQSYKGPFPVNKNYMFEAVRRDMQMPSDGPTLNEFSDIDTTQDLNREEAVREVDSKRPVSPRVKVNNWWSDNARSVIIAVIATIITGLLGEMVVRHKVHLAEHDREFKFMEKEIGKNQSDIEKLNEKTNTLDRDFRLLEQKVEYSFESNKKNKTKK